jgi:hypothetical protein
MGNDVFEASGFSTFSSWAWTVLSALSTGNFSGSSGFFSGSSGFFSDSSGF